MSYISEINELLAATANAIPQAVLFGENIDTGSRISGLTRNLVDPPGGKVLNVGNCELTHCGVGFGLMVEGLASVLFAKQLDFMLLGVDHFVSTYNALRQDPGQPPTGSFTIVVVVCDQGLQGPQSSFNALGDLCSMARVPGFTLTNRVQAEQVISSQLGAPGFRFVTLSQRLFGTELLDLPCLARTDDGLLFHHLAGDDATIVSLNFSLPQAVALHESLASAGVGADLFAASYGEIDWTSVVDSARRTGRIVVLDDSKSLHSPGHGVLEQVATAAPAARRTFVGRDEIEHCVSPEVYEPPTERIRQALGC